MNNYIKTVMGIMIFVTLMDAGAVKEVAPVEAKVLEIPAEEVSPWYIGAGLIQADFLKDPCSAFDPSCKYEDVTNGLMIRGGYDFNPYIGIEARGAKTFWDKGPYGGVPLEHIGLFLKPQYPLTERLNLYGLLGVGYTKNLGSGARLAYFDHDSGFSAGMGIEFDFSYSKGDFLENVNYDRTFDGYADQGRGWALFVDYQRLLIKASAPDMDMFSLGLRYDF
jgi:opacity protein-like surface antigen